MPDLLSAELLLFGDYTHRLSLRNAPPGGEDRLDDLAQAWIDGDRERVLAAVKAHELAVRSRPVRDKKVTRLGRGRPRTVDRARVLELRAQGMKPQAIAKQLGCSVWTVYRIQ